MFKDIKIFLILLSCLTFSACSGLSHFALGPIQNIELSELPKGMLPNTKTTAREEARTMVLWLLAKNIEKTKSSPPEMLRGLAYLEFVLNDILEDLDTTIATKTSVKKIVLNLRDALGMPIYAPPGQIINMYWSTAKFMEINKFSMVKLATPVTAKLENLSAVKSAISMAITTAKLNIITEKNKEISTKIGEKELTFEGEIYKNTELPNFTGLRLILPKANNNTPPKPWTHWSEDLKENLKSISQLIDEKNKFFSKLNSDYERNFFIATGKVFKNILDETQDSWLVLQKLQKLSDFMTLASQKLPKRLIVDKKRKTETQAKLRALKPNDYNNLRQFLLNFSKIKITRLTTFKHTYNQRPKYLIPAINHLDSYQINLDELITKTNSMPIDQIAKLSKLLAGSDLTSRIESLSRKVVESSEDISGAARSISSEISYAAGQYLASIGADLHTVANSVASAIQAGIAADLNALAQGMGFSSFADAVAAYNAQYGTSYSVQQARDALSGK
jgi:hypothetical protein